MGSLASPLPQMLHVRMETPKLFEISFSLQECLIDTRRVPDDVVSPGGAVRQKMNICSPVFANLSLMKQTDPHILFLMMSCRHRLRHSLNYTLADP